MGEIGKAIGSAALGGLTGGIGGIVSGAIGGIGRLLGIGSRKEKKAKNTRALFGGLFVIKFLLCFIL